MPRPAERPDRPVGRRRRCHIGHELFVEALAHLGGAAGRRSGEYRRGDPRPSVVKTSFIARASLPAVRRQNAHRTTSSMICS